MKTRILVALALFAGILAVAPSAGAEQPKKDNKGYEYKFEDDNLLTATGGAMGPLITVVKSARRERLLRPRTQFIPEMLKSVENM